MVCTKNTSCVAYVYKLIFQAFIPFSIKNNVSVILFSWSHSFVYYLVFHHDLNEIIIIITGSSLDLGFFVYEKVGTS